MAQARSLIRFMGNSPLSHKVSKQQYKWCVMSIQFELQKPTELLI
jgi:hypothetical protein